jgi:hypothetical protein
MQSSTFGERVTAGVSTLVAVAILGAAVTAQQASTPVADAVADFESDLRYQIDLTLRGDGSALKAAHAGVDNALAAWRGSPQSLEDRQTLLAWFDAAISATMPGHSGKLPPQPEFTSERPIVIAPPRLPMPPAPAEPTPVVAEPEVATETLKPPVSPIEPATAASEVTEAVPVELQSTMAEVVADQPPVVESTPVEHSVTITPAQPVAEVPANPTSSVDPAASEVATLNAPPIGTTPYEATTESPTVNLNLVELNARIGGYNQRLAEIEASMVVGAAGSGARLTALVEEIEQLAQQYGFIKLYYDSLNETERRRVSEPRSMSDAVTHASRLVARDEDAADFLADFEAADAAPTLTDRLQAVAESAELNQ